MAPVAAGQALATEEQSQPVERGAGEQGWQGHKQVAGTGGAGDDYRRPG
jgi:hypothetical protein